MGEKANRLSFGLFHQNFWMIKMKRHSLFAYYLLYGLNLLYQVVKAGIVKDRASILVIKFVFETQQKSSPTGHLVWSTLIR